MFIGICYLVSLVVGTAAALQQPGPHTVQAVAETLLRFVLLIGAGVPLVAGGYGHVFQSDLAASRLGWETGNPFQKELGFWDFAGGIGALAAFWVGGDFRLAIIFINAVFWLSAGALHIRHVAQHHNYNADNAISAGADILVPFTLITLFLLAR